MLLVAQASFPEEASTQGFRSSAACKASGLSLYRNLRRPFSFPSEERVGSPPPPLVPTRSHDHWPRFLCLPTGRTDSAEYTLDAARTPVRGAVTS
jgi:hypothetical protein